MPNVLFAIPDGPLKSHMFSAEWRARLEGLTQVEWNDTGRELTSAELAERITDKDILITGWGSPRVTDAVLNAAPRLKMIAHSAGTVRWLVEESFFDRGIVLTNANLALAPSVAEYCLMTILMARWRILDSIKRVRDGLWQSNNDIVPGLNGAKIGLIGYGAIAEELIRLLRQFDVRIAIHSEHLSEEQARQMGVRRCSMEEALHSDVVSLHKTLTESTRHMIGKRELDMIPDGGILINTSRGALIDEAELIHQLERGRIHAVLDVFEEEPLPHGHPLRTMPGAIVTPHCAGTSAYFRQAMAELVLSDIECVLNDMRPRGAISKAKYMSMTPM
ncbi:hydroxyacid dehydrogenase [Eubacteriales bacterium OttesenSCG-928-N13]|nr:hydroxyacid dehydrogenase [Eubacteriales bacterium OttesenSCG-928-N13]